MTGSTGQGQSFGWYIFAQNMIWEEFYCNIFIFPGKQFDALYVKSSHFLVGRCVKGFRFPPTCRRAERRHLEGILQGSLEMLEGSFFY